ncbi:hypothetical protein VTH06DRAFT_992 [Thermothelomyces fergusii]
MPRKAPELDLDFNLYVDPPCLTEPMDGKPPATVPPSADGVCETVAPDKADSTADRDETAHHATGDAAEHQKLEPPTPERDLALLESEGPKIEETAQPEVEATEHVSAATQPETFAGEKPLEESPSPEHKPPAADGIASSMSIEDGPETRDRRPGAEIASEPRDIDESSFGPERTDEYPADAAAEEGAVAESPVAQGEQDGGAVGTRLVEEPEPAGLGGQAEEKETAAEDAPRWDGPVGEHMPPPEAPAEKGDSSPESREALTENGDVEGSQKVESNSADEEGRGPQRNITDRKTSLRTEALIQAAARAVVAKIEKRKSGGPPDHEDDFDQVLIAADSHDTNVLGADVRDIIGASTRPLSRESSGSRAAAAAAARHIPSRSTSSDEAGDSSSHNGRDDDLFSLHSTRSSLCSAEHEDFQTKTPQAMESVSRRESYASTLHHQPYQDSSPSPARTASNFSSVSGLSQYEHEFYDSDLSPKHAFIPYDGTIKAAKPNNRRMPFRTPSEIRAMQMASPTPSVFNGSSPVRRSPGSSGRREGSGKRSSLSRLGSPAAASAQYSPKGRSTPPRFKSAPPQEAPLVLLHVTLLPLRWAWAGVLESLDSFAVGGSKAAGVATAEEGSSVSPEAGSGSGLPSSAAAAAAAAAALRAFEPSDQLRSLRDAWRELQDRIGDTVLERGILLPHPQSDYEVLEERLLEALELPLRRRARILECGHYVGPANVDPEESSDEDCYDDEEKGEEERKKRRWCITCREEIRYEDLGPGKVFRVKVYASNGLMKAGAWEACWKEMERVDVELEPIVDVAVQNELEKLAVLQMELEEQRRRELEMFERTPEPEAEPKYEPAAVSEHDPRASSRQQTDYHNAEAELARVDAQRTAMSSPAPAPGMQLAMSSSTVQRSASTTLVPAAAPATCPIDSSEERRLRDEERMREIYGDNSTAPPPPAPAPASAQAADPAQMPAPPAPADQVQYQQQQTQQQQQQHQHGHYQQLQNTHSQALTTIAPPPSMPLLADAPYRHQSQHDPYRASTYHDPYDQRGRRHGQQQRPPARSIVLDENSGFVELLMEAFKVLLRDPKNVAIIVLCLFVVVLMKRPGEGLQPQQPLPAPPSSQPQQPQPEQQQQQQQQPPVVQVVLPPSEPAGGYRAEEGLGNGPAGDDAQAASKGGIVVPPSANAPVMEYVEEVLASMAVPDRADGLGSVVAAPEPAAVVEQVGHASAVEESAAAESIKAAAPASSVPVDACLPRGLEYPVTPVGEVPEHGGAAASSEAAVEAEVDGDADGDCEEEEESADDAAVAAATAGTASSAATSSASLAGPLVTERKTVRVFETVTETVRVSVVTQTETVSTVVTAVPQTVEETVYETETVRITVSVPVEEQQQQKKKKAQAAGKGCKRTGWF